MGYVAGDVVGGIMALEAGELDDMGTLELFAELTTSGAVWNLQGSYGRTAAGLLEDGYLVTDENGVTTVSEWAREAWATLFDDGEV